MNHEENNSEWVKYPQSMCNWKAISFLSRNVSIDFIPKRKKRKLFILANMKKFLSKFVNIKLSGWLLDLIENELSKEIKK